MMRFYKEDINNVIRVCKSNLSGLNEKEVLNNRIEFGLNQLEETKQIPWYIIFINQFKDFLVLLLIIAAFVSAMMGKFESTVVIFAVLILNAVLGTVQHIKAEQSLKSLKALSAPTAKVLRAGIVTQIPSIDVVVGDILIIEAGDFISADARLIEANSLQVGESALTGESTSVDKTIDTINEIEVATADQRNMIFSSSHVTYGRGKAVVTHVGKETEIGKIATLLSTAKEKSTPLQENLDDFGKKLALIILIISSFVFISGIVKGTPIMDALMFAISLAVAAIPEALSSIVTIVLALGTKKIADNNAIIRKLHAVEMLGTISVICSDKTGTLTQNKMTVQSIYTDHLLVKVDDIDISNKLQHQIVLSGLLCSDAVTVQDKEIGDPTEVALINLGEKFSMDELIQRKQTPRISELPFDSDRKLMSTLQFIGHKKTVFTKGALDVLIKRSKYIETSDGVRELSDADKQKFYDINFDLSNQGLRVLAFAWKNIEENALSLNDENEMTIFGLVAMMDPPRVESKSAVQQCINAGIKPVMITGDHKITASAIAREIGILKEGDLAVEGIEIENLTESQLQELVPKVSVFARVSPEHKIRIVSAWQDLNHVVAMTGDGVNDAPALKRAHVGIAMGITGTEVAKDAASMVLMDDNFSTIVKAINNGRSIFSNIKNAIRFLLSGNTAGIMAVLYASIAGLNAPFSPVHLLFINLLTDSLPAIAIGLEPAHGNLMNKKPRNAKKSIIDRHFIKSILFEGFIIAFATMSAYYIGLSQGDHHVASTMAFITLSLTRLIHGLTCRMEEPLNMKNIMSNPWIFIALFTGIILLGSVILIKPLHALLEVSVLTFNQLLSIIVISVIPLILFQIIKRVENYINVKNGKIK
ncbi:MAG: ATPase [Clostridiales bacterium 38-18]|nr:MAG: ATPase [Clostridiales bacterium 38-18]